MIERRGTINKTKIIVLLLLFKIFYPSTATCQWIHSSDINKGLISTIGVKDSIIFFGGYNLSDSTISYFHSKDYGSSWKESFNPQAEMPNTFVITDNYIFCGDGHEGGHIFRTSDWGLNWEDCFNQMIGVRALIYSGNSLYAAVSSDYCPQGVWKSSDDGDNWTEIWYGACCTNTSLLVLDSLIFVGTDDMGIYGSSDSGNTWKALNNGLPVRIEPNPYQEIRRIHSLILFKNKIFAGIMGVYYSTDFGLNWQPACDGLDSTSIRVLAASDDHLFAASGSKVFILLLEEMKWKDITANFPGELILSMAVSRDNLFLGTTQKGLWYRSISNILTNMDKKIIISDNYSLSQNFPNPFNPVTKIKYTLPKSGFVSLKIYDLLGREISTLVNENKPNGKYEIEFDGSHLANGVYIYRLQVGGYSNAKKLILMK